MPRNRPDPDESPEDVDWLQPLHGSYYPPGYDGNRFWQLPPSADILDDIKSQGYSIVAVTHAILPQGSSLQRQALLSALLEQLHKCEYGRKIFEEYEKIFEETQTLLIENRLRAAAASGMDGAAARFYLERRQAEKFGRSAKQAKDTKAGKINELAAALKQRQSGA